MRADATISWVPDWVPAEAMRSFSVDTGGGLLAHCACPVVAQWDAIGEGLRRAQRALRALPIARVIAALDAVAARFCDRADPVRLRSRDAVVASTGFSPEAVERSFDVELANYRAAALRRLMRRELGCPEAVDGFQHDEALGGKTVAVGPRITLALFTGNVPGLPALSLVRALLVKSAVIAKVASGEPTFAAHFAQALAEEEPVLGAALLITYWDRADHGALRGALSQADAVIGYGGEAACAALRAQLLPGQRYIEHGHKLSVGVLSKGYVEAVGLAEVGQRVARDVSTFNQHACIAPQAYLVEGSVAEAARVAEAIAQALGADAASCPLGTLDGSAAAGLQLQRTAAAWAAATDPARGLWRAQGLDWTVILDRDVSSVSGSGNRVVRVVPLAALDGLSQALAPIARYLQNVGLGVLGEAFLPIAEHLARLGACRVSEPGRMAEPSVIWKHDGEACLARLVRFCDIEMHREVETDRETR